MDKSLQRYFGPLESTEEEIRRRIDSINNLFTQEVGTFEGMRIIRSQPKDFPNFDRLEGALQEDLRADKAKAKQQEHKRLSKLALGPKRGRWAKKQSCF